MPGTASSLPLKSVLLGTAIAITLLGCEAAPSSEQQTPQNEASASPVEFVQVVDDERGMRLTVDGEDFFVMGMNWDYFPRGTNYAFSLWSQPDDVIKDALDREMSMMQEAGINAIRQYVGVPPRWVAYIHKNYGIYTVLNHALGRYGVSVDGEWIANTDYADPASREVIISEVVAMVEAFKDTPGVLMWLLGNENNYGLVWSGAETENLPEEELNVQLATPLYTLFGEAADRIKEIDTLRPVAMANGDLGYMDLLVEHAASIDVFGTNVYRGLDFTDLFDRVHEEFGKPVMLTEFGADAYDAKQGREDQETQAKYFHSQWRDIYANASGFDGAGNSVGGLAFQWSDGWWKHGQETRLDVHDTTASWHNEGYPEDFEEGQDNMNEEWFGVVAKGPTDERWQFDLIPRTAYHVIQEIHTLDPYAAGVDSASMDAHFDGIAVSGYPDLDQ